MDRSYCFSETSLTTLLPWLQDALDARLVVDGVEQRALSRITLVRGSTGDDEQRKVASIDKGELDGITAGSVVERLRDALEMKGRYTVILYSRSGTQNEQGHEVLERRFKTVTVEVELNAAPRSDGASPVNAALGQVLVGSIQEHSAAAVAAREAETRAMDRLLERIDAARAEDAAVRDTYSEELRKVELDAIEVRHSFEIYKIQNGFWGQVGPALVPALVPIVPQLLQGLVDLIKVGGALLASRAQPAQLAEPPGWAELQKRVGHLEEDLAESAAGTRAMLAEMKKISERLGSAQDHP